MNHPLILRWQTQLKAVAATLLLAPILAQAQTTTFTYTGGAQTYTVPAGITALQVVATGASGGTYNGGTNYGYGAQVQATVQVAPGEVLTVLVGGQGGSSGPGSGTVAGGYNGGGAGRLLAAGGGASDIRRTGASTGDYLTTRNALVVAGGGGGSGIAPATGGGGGGATDLRRNGLSTGDYLTSRNALLVAGGRGGSSFNSVLTGRANAVGGPAVMGA